MPGYIDGFVHPIPRSRLNDYRKLVIEVAQIWKQHGALDYQEFVGDDLVIEGVRPFTDLVPVSDDEVLMFGWVSFTSRVSRDEVNHKVESDPRMAELMAASETGFDETRMVFGGMQAWFPSPGDS